MEGCLLELVWKEVQIPDKIRHGAIPKPMILQFTKHIQIGS